MDVPRQDVAQDPSGGDPPEVPPQQEGAGRNNWALILLLIPYVTLLYVPFYNSLTPKLGAVPYFIWYQFLWVLIGAAITGVVYWLRD
jgi:hypothetical protein